MIVANGNDLYCEIEHLGKIHTFKIGDYRYITQEEALHIEEEFKNGLLFNLVAQKKPYTPKRAVNIDLKKYLRQKSQLNDSSVTIKRYKPRKKPYTIALKCYLFLKIYPNGDKKYLIIDHNYQTKYFQKVIGNTKAITLQQARAIVDDYVCSRIEGTEFILPKLSNKRVGRFNANCNEEYISSLEIKKFSYQRTLGNGLNVKIYISGTKTYFFQSRYGDIIYAGTIADVDKISLDEVKEITKQIHKCIQRGVPIVIKKKTYNITSRDVKRASKTEKNAENVINFINSLKS